MKVNNLFTDNKDQVLKEVLKLNNKTEEDLKRDIEILRNWLKTQKHLPEIPNDNMIRNFLLMNKFSIEISKEKLDMFYTIRSLLPEVFKNKHPRLPGIKDVKDIMCMVFLPKLIDKCLRVLIFQVKKMDPEHLDFHNFLGHFFNLLIIRIDEDILNKDVYIFDFKHVVPKHLTKITPLGIKKGTVVLEKVFSSRIAQIHFVNCPPYADTIINICKTVLKPKLAARIKVHKRLESLVEYVPLEILPSDFGGNEMSLAELEELLTKKSEEYYDRFDALEQMKVNESLRPTPLVNDDILGFYGNFKKLSVD